ncbi:molybdopterin-dependent oxidoreductase [Nocardia sp. NBC_01377]|uniref:molybdopterin-dependent oxidoreductase n=1 Tax=Nocardia sp. NBC_01377 TaxID=2903595 RepID=UPI00386DDB04
MADLRAEAGVRPGADLLLSRSVDGFTAGTPVSAVTDGRDALLAVGMNGGPLPIEHGYPARLVVPGGRRGRRRGAAARHRPGRGTDRREPLATGRTRHGILRRHVAAVVLVVGCRSRHAHAAGACRRPCRCGADRRTRPSVPRRFDRMAQPGRHRPVMLSAARPPSWRDRRSSSRRAWRCPRPSAPRRSMA